MYLTPVYDTHRTEDISNPFLMLYLKLQMYLTPLYAPHRSEHISNPFLMLYLNLQMYLIPLYAPHRSEHLSNPFLMLYLKLQTYLTPSSGPHPIVSVSNLFLMLYLKFQVYLTPFYFCVWIFNCIHLLSLELFLSAGVFSNSLRVRLEVLTGVRRFLERRDLNPSDILGGKKVSHPKRFAVRVQ
jgi:hypothetical protein